MQEACPSGSQRLDHVLGLDATWGKPVPPEVFAESEAVLNARIPVAWRDYLTRDRWLTKGLVAVGRVHAAVCAGRGDGMDGGVESCA